MAQRHNPRINDKVSNCPRRHLSGLFDILALSMEITKVAASFNTAIKIINRSGKEKSKARSVIKKKIKKWIVEAIRYTK